MDDKKLIENLVDVSQVPFAAAYLNNEGDICEYGPYQIDFAHEVPHIPLFTKEQLERFAELSFEQERKESAEHYLKLIRDCVATEREACAKVAESEPKVWRTDAPAPQQRIAAAIRARSK